MSLFKGGTGLVGAMALFAGLSMSVANATPLRMDYSVTDLGGGLYDYDFSLVLDNNDGSWVAGDGWSWIIFGDQQSASSPLTNFVGDVGDLPIGLFTSYMTSTGFHNGPTLSPLAPTYWIPNALGDFLSWSGTSDANLGQGELLFSTLQSVGGVEASFEVANLVSVPEPATLALLGLGVAGIGYQRRKQNKAA